MPIGQHSEEKTDKLLAASKRCEHPRSGDCDVTAAPDAATKFKEPKLATDDGEYA